MPMLNVSLVPLPSHEGEEGRGAIFELGGGRLPSFLAALTQRHFFSPTLLTLLCIFASPRHHAFVEEEERQAEKGSSLLSW